MNDEQTITEPQATEVTFEVLPPATGIAQQPVLLKKATSLWNLWDAWISMKSATAAPRTVQEYYYGAQHFCKFFRQHSAKNPMFTPQGMSEWMEHLRKSPVASPKRTNKINKVVKPFLRWMKLMRYINEDLAACLPKLPVPAPKESVIITEEEYEKIKAYCAGRPKFQTHLWLCILAYRTGMSLVDCCHLRWKDVHLEDNGPSYIDIYRIKIKRMGDKAKCQIPIVPMSDLHLWLLNLKKVTPWKRHDGITDYVHQETQGFYIYAAVTIHQEFRKLFMRAGVAPGKTFRCFRNSLCSNLVNAGVQMALVCKITGHNSVTTLLRYLKADRRALQDGMARAQQYSAQKSDGKENTGLQDGDAAYL